MSGRGLASERVVKGALRVGGLRGGVFCWLGGGFAVLSCPLFFCDNDFEPTPSPEKMCVLLQVTLSLCLARSGCTTSAVLVAALHFHTPLLLDLCRYSPSQPAHCCLLPPPLWRCTTSARALALGLQPGGLSFLAFFSSKTTLTAFFFPPQDETAARR